MRMLSVLLFGFLGTANGCFPTKDGGGPLPAKDCQNCAALEILMGGRFQRNFALNQPGTATDGCATRTLRCDGVPNAARTELNWNQGAPISRDAPASVQRTVKCNAEKKWILTENEQQTAVQRVACVSSAEEVPECQRCTANGIGVIAQAPFKEMEAGIVVIEGGCATRTFTCNAVPNAGRLRLVWNTRDRMNGENAQISEDERLGPTIRRTARCNAEGRWMLEDVIGGMRMEFEVTEVGCFSDAAVQNCAGCEPNVVIPNNGGIYNGMLEIQDIGFDPMTNCRTMTVQCRSDMAGAQNLQIRWNDNVNLVSNGGVGENPFEKTLRCDAENNWKLDELGGDPPPTIDHAGCIVRANEPPQNCGECVPGAVNILDIVDDGIYDGMMGVEFGNHPVTNCPMLTLRCEMAGAQNLQIRWNNNANLVSNSGAGENPFEKTLRCDAENNWKLDELGGDPPPTIDHAGCIVRANEPPQNCGECVPGAVNILDIVDDGIYDGMMGVEFGNHPVTNCPMLTLRCEMAGAQNLQIRWNNNANLVSNGGAGENPFEKTLRCDAENNWKLDELGGDPPPTIDHAGCIVRANEPQQNQCRGCPNFMGDATQTPGAPTAMGCSTLRLQCGAQHTALRYNDGVDIAGNAVQQLLECGNDNRWTRPNDRMPVTSAQCVDCSKCPDFTINEGRHVEVMHFNEITGCRAVQLSCEVDLANAPAILRWNDGIETMGDVFANPFRVEVVLDCNRNGKWIRNDRPLEGTCDVPMPNADNCKTVTSAECTAPMNGVQGDPPNRCQECTRDQIRLDDTQPFLNAIEHTNFRVNRGCSEVTVRCRPDENARSAHFVWNGNENGPVREGDQALEETIRCDPQGRWMLGGRTIENVACIQQL
ncbi:hypothetical protein L596_014363 [Steinernema carpocapsae]|uniref:C6 domain-containing protein n=1 Tax=Steinernema carpocapsae TaxID=34508 RepID=A0A4U5NCI1_STECR|nr:hypothetical protein L596_014363 [Steinernema carpocapsae]